jgi:hypothetical protein
LIDEILGWRPRLEVKDARNAPETEGGNVPERFSLRRQCGTAAAHGERR